MGLDTLVKEGWGLHGVLRGDDEVIQLALEKSPRELVGLRVSLLSGRCCHDVCLTWESRRDVLRIRYPFSVGTFGTGSERTGSKCNSQCFYRLQSSAMVQ